VEPKNCGSGFFANATSKDCQSCNSGESLTPFSSEDHTHCLTSALDCGEGNSELNGYQCINCRTIDVTTPYASEKHDACYFSKLDCGDGNIATSGFQCKRCETIDKKTPYSSKNHEECVKSFDCGSGFKADVSTKNCLSCGSKYASLDHFECLSEPELCGEGNVGDESTKQCKQCKP